MSSIEDQIMLNRLRQFPIEAPYQQTKSQREALAEKNEVFQKIIEEFPEQVGKEASEYEREMRDFGEISDSTLTYGEIDFISLGEVFDSIKYRFNALPSGGIFYDLGSGTGKGVIAAALLGRFDVCRGIELLESLFNISLQMKIKYEEIKPKLEFDYAHLVDRVAEIEFVYADIFQYDWTDASVILANSTCFSQSMMDQIAEIRVKEGTVAISLTQRIPGPNWIMLESIKKNMSWGIATVNIQRRIS